MNRLNPNSTTHNTTWNWSARLGKLATVLPAPAATATPLGAPPPNRLSAILAHLGRRTQVRNEMNRSLRAHEFMAP